MMGIQFVVSGTHTEALLRSWTGVHSTKNPKDPKDMLHETEWCNLDRMTAINPQSNDGKEQGARSNTTNRNKDTSASTRVTILIIIETYLLLLISYYYGCR